MSGTMAVLDRIEEDRDRLLAELGAADPDDLRRRPGPGSWCVLEVVEHLVLSERTVLRGLFETELLKSRPRTLRHRILRWVVRGVLRSGIPVKAPSRSMLPGGDLGLPVLEAMWEENHRLLRDYLSGIESGREGEAVFRHPVAGPLQPAAAVDLMAVHLRRHRGQISRLLASGRSRRT